MRINTIHLPVYGFFIVLSILVGMLYIYKSIKNKKNLYLYFILYISFALVCGKILTMITSLGKVDFLHAGLSSLGGVTGAILSAIIFEKIENHQNEILKYTILSLPLVYSISKIGCFLAGCCSGIPYKGIGYVIYTNGLNEPVFPIQLLETITFFIIWIILNHMKEKKNILLITIEICSLTKFLLDFLRVDHLEKSVTITQILCIIMAILPLMIKGGRKLYDNRRIKTRTTK